MAYYRRRSNPKKYKRFINDLEVLGYNHHKLIEILTSLNKQITCSRCLNITVLKELSSYNVHSGQYGIYFKCSKCQKNVSIPAKIDFNKDHIINEIDDFITSFNKDLKNAQKQYYKIKSLVEKLREEGKKHSQNLKKLATKKFIEASEMHIQISDCCLTYEQDTSILRFLGEATGISEKEHEVITIERNTRSVKKTHIARYRKLYKKQQELYEESKILEKQAVSATIVSTGDLEEKYRNSFDFINKYFLKHHYEYKTLSHIEELDPNKNKDLETIEELHLTPLIKKKEKRILLLKKIFRSSKGSVYVLESDAMPGFYKIGWTERSPHERAKELSGTSVPSPYRVVFSKSTNLTGEVEKEVHTMLDNLRHRSNREFFKGDLKLIKKTIEQVLTN